MYSGVLGPRVPRGSFRSGRTDASARAGQWESAPGPRALRSPNPRVAPEFRTRGDATSPGPGGGSLARPRGLVGAARATTAAGGDESYHGDRRDHRENSDCNPGFSANRHRISPFVQGGSFISTTTVALSEIGRSPACAVPSATAQATARQGVALASGSGPHRGSTRRPPARWRMPPGGPAPAPCRAERRTAKRYDGEGSGD